MEHAVRPCTNSNILRWLAYNSVSNWYLPEASRHSSCKGIWKRTLIHAPLRYTYLLPQHICAHSNAWGYRVCLPKVN